MTLLLIAIASTAFATGVPADAEMMDPGFHATGLPIVDDKITISAFAQHNVRAHHYDDFPMFQALEEATNVRIDWEMVPQGQEFNERRNLMLASGDYPDLFWGAGLTDLEVMNNLSAFVPLSGLIDRYGPNIKAFWDKTPGAKGISISPDGEIYSLSHRRPHRPSNYGHMAVNKEWLDAVGMDPPETLDQFTAMLRAFKTQDPNGNGQADEIPLSSSTWLATHDWFYGVFGMPRGRTDLRMVVDGEVQFVGVMDEFKAMVEYLHMLYDERLLDIESLTQSQNQWRAKLAHPDYRIVGAAWVFTIEAQIGTDATDEYIYIHPVSSPYGPGYTNDNTFEPIARNRASIFVSNPYPEATMRWLDQIYTDDLSVEMQYGSLGYQLEKTSDGRYRFLPPEDGMTYDDEKWTWAPSNWAPMGVYRALEDRIIPNPETEALVEVTAFNEPYLETGHAYPPVFFSEEESEEMSILQTDIWEYTRSTMANWIAEGGIDEEWDGYVAQLDRLGLPRLLEMFQEGYDRYYN